MDPAIYGQKIKQIYASGVAKDGRKYTDIPDAELGAKYIQAQGLDKASAALGIDLQGIQDQRKQATAQATSDTEADKAYTLAKGSIQNLLDTYNNLPELQKTQGFASLFNRVNSQGADYGAQALGLAPALKSIEGAGKGSGVRVTQAELQAWSKLLPSTTKNDATNKQDLISLNKQLKNSFGQGLDQQYLQRYGISPDTGESQSPIKSNAAGLLNNPVAKFLIGDIPATANTLKDTGAAVGQMALQPHQNQQIQQGNDLLAQIKAETDPTKRQALIEQARQQFGKGSDTANKLASMFSPDVNKSALVRGPQAVGTLASLLVAPGIVNGAKNLITGGGRAALSNVLPNASQDVTQTVNPSRLSAILQTGGRSSKAASQAEKAVNSATGAGAKIDYQNLADKIRSAVTEKLGSRADVKSAVDQIISEKTPAELGSPQINPSDVLDWRRQITNRAPKGFIEKFLNNNNMQTKVEAVARNVISNELHQAVPSTVGPDKAYSFYKSIHGDLPSWIKKIAVGYGIDKTIGNRAGGAGHIADLLGLLVR